MWGLLLAASLSGAPPLGAKAGADEEAIRKLVDAFRVACEREDEAALLGLFWPEANVFEHGGVDRTAEAFVKEHMAPHFKEMSLRWLEEESSGRSEGAMAYVAQRAKLEIREADGPPKHAYNTFTFVLRKRQGAWKISHLHWSLGRPKPPEAADGGSPR
ncbi:MAG: nuclear transport factor 2 family protein [Myxococcales bacterium]|nr:nuclear transport factor 2 family protein [Myxococcales bacterium]